VPEIAFQWEPLDELLADPVVMPMIEQQHRALSSHKEPLDPDWDRMFEAEKQGGFRLWTARDGDTLAGFIQWQIFRPYGYRDVLFAWDCGHYLDAKYRSPWLWIKMWTTAGAALKELGVALARGHDNAAQPMPSAFKRLGYMPIGTLYERRL
jgi:hypothetical protein